MGLDQQTQPLETQAFWQSVWHPKVVPAPRTAAPTTVPPHFNHPILQALSKWSQTVSNRRPPACKLRMPEPCGLESQEPRPTPDPATDMRPRAPVW